ncbi:MAG: CBS domain-containing protein [Ferruginibacter sp.]|nr:CBS domain-containing protein [Ferruginibacter sp.]
MTVSQLLSSKGSLVFSITASITVYEAIKIMGEKNIGALLVIENDVLKGILSERDYARKVVLKDKTSRGTLVKDIMTENVITITPNQTIENCMELMSTKHIRHLPVCDSNKVVGIISISDIVTAIINSQKETIEHLHSYITS